MRKITSLLMLLCMFVGTAWAQLPTVSNAPSNGAWAEGTKWYTIKQNDKNFVSLGNADANGYLMLNSTDAKGAAALWCVVGNATDGYQLYNYSAGTSKVLGAYGSEANGRMKMYDLDATKDGSNTLTKTFDIVALEGQTGFAFVKNHGSERDWWNSRDNYLAYWNSDYAYDAGCDGSKYTFTEVTDFTTLIDIDATKTAAKAELDTLEKISAIFPALTTEKTQIDAITPATKSLSDLNSAYEKITAILVNYKLNANGKNVKLSNLRAAPDDRNGRFIVYDKANNRAAAAVDGGDAAIWTIKSNADGTFKMYNFVSNLYLGIPGSNNGDTPMHENESDAAAMSIIPTGENALALVSGGKMAHCANNNNYRIMHYWDTNDGASLWKVELSNPIVVSREIYDAAAAAKATLPYAIQQAYGLVTDAKNYYSNWKSDAEGSYEALLDNETGTYFHSAYTAEATANTADAHYIQANLGTAIGEFYFYMSPRTQNGNNRPINITVSGSNTEDGQFTKIADVTTTLDGSTNPYFSAKLGAAGTKYKYIRLIVNSTNNDTKFFTLSELYFLPSNNDVDNLLVSYANFASSSITSANMASAANALINAEGVLALSNIKKEIKAILDANVSNHAATPALGQYSTAAYNALKTAYESSKATQESLETALAAFNNSKNIPVYFITSAQEGYAKGSAIYYDGEWKWKAANKLDRQMWMTIPGYTKADVPVVDDCTADGTFYELCDYLTRTLMRGKKIQIVKIAGWDGAYNLQYNANDESLDAAHHAKDDGSLVNWCPGTKDDAQASVWHVEYIGTSYELANLTDEKIQALAALKTAYDAKAYYKNVEVGTGLGQYKGDKDAIVAELAKAEAVYVKTLAEQAAMTVEEINAITKSITDVAALTVNLPTPGKYYLIHSSLSLFAEHQAGKVKAVYSDGTNVKWTTANEDDKTFYWQAVATSDGGVVLQNAKDNKYMTGKDENGAWTVSDTYTDAAKLDIRLFAKGETAEKNEYGVILNGWQMHCYGHDKGKGESGNVISWNTDNANSASSWYVVEVELPVFYDVTYNFVYNGEVKFSQTSSIKKDAAYPDIVVPAIPYGVTTKATKPEGTVTKNVVVNFELTIEKELPFVTAQSAENITKWYYMRMHTNQPGFIGDIAEDNTINVAWGKTATADKLENFMWGFVGDVFGGITVVNKGTGLQLNSTGDGNATLAETGTSFFIAATTETSANAKYGFCLRKKDSTKYLNANYGAGKLSHWESTDAGSTFFLTEADKATKVKVSNAGYATLFLDYATYIPKEVEAYIVASIDNTSATLAQVTGTLKEKTGVIVKAAEGVYNFTVSAEAAASVSGNLLRGSVEDAYIEGEAYVLANAKNGVGLYKAELNKNANGETGTTHFLNNANKAYLPKPAEASARFLSFDFGTETAIDELKGENGNVNAVIYDLSGRRVQKAQKGVFIVNGKVVIK